MNISTSAYLDRKHGKQHRVTDFHSMPWCRWLVLPAKKLVSKPLRHSG